MKQKLDYKVPETVQMFEECDGVKQKLDYKVPETVQMFEDKNVMV